jgi:hypothetical protein
MGKRTCALVSDPPTDNGGRSGRFALARGPGTDLPQRTEYIEATNLKLYTNYSPPNDPDGQYKTKAEAEAAELVEHR